MVSISVKSTESNREAGKKFPPNMREDIDELAGANWVDLINVKKISES
jgi:hypothetical protein